MIDIDTREKMNLIQEAKQNFKCQIYFTDFHISSKTFLKLLKTHVQRVHEKIKFKCVLCSKCFAQMACLRAYQMKNPKCETYLQQLSLDEVSEKNHRT